MGFDTELAAEFGVRGFGIPEVGKMGRISVECLFASGSLLRAKIYACFGVRHGFRLLLSDGFAFPTACHRGVIAERARFPN